MATLHNLTLRTATAVGRLAELQRRADRAGEKPTMVAKSALQELSVALEELQVANEALTTQLDELNGVRAQSTATNQAMEEFTQALPVATLWTDQAGVIQKSNEAASQLLNIGKHHLAGKPLMLFFTDRTILFGALRTLCEGDVVTAVDVEITVRPRERRPRKMKLYGRRLSLDTRCVWFLIGSSTSCSEVPHPQGFAGDREPAGPGRTE